MMRNSDSYRITRLLLRNLPDFVTNKKGLIFIPPVGNVLRGFLFESSANSREDFYFWWFFLPICEPVTYLSLANGARLDVPGKTAGWRSDMAGLPEALLAAMTPFALPYLRSIRTNQDTINALRERRSETVSMFPPVRQVNDIYVQHDIACLHILEGQYQEAQVMLDAVIAHEHGTDRRQWLLDVVDRTKGLRRLFLKDPALAVAQIRDWQDYTFKALKLEAWR